MEKWIIGTLGLSELNPIQTRDEIHRILVKTIDPGSLILIATII
jgi:hypothetical protein